jgi:hypothetical protein
MGAGVGGAGAGGKGGFLANMVQQVVGQNPQQSNNFTYNPAQPNQYNIDYNNYSTSQLPTSQTTNNVSGEAFGTGVNSNSDIASVIAGLVSSGVFNQQGGNPYAPPETVPPSHIPYGQQQGSMFGRNDLMPRNPQGPFGGYQGQNWNPYGNYYTSGPASPANTSNLRPADKNEGLKRLAQVTQQQQNLQI